MPHGIVMVIISQNKESIINFDNIGIMGIDSFGLVECILNFDCRKIVIGSYPTKERAKEIIQEIYHFYDDSKNSDRFNLHGRYIYEMPLE